MRPALVLAFCFTAACGGGDRPVQAGGSVFGTSWSLTYLNAPDHVTNADVHSAVEAAFATVNESMNHYDPNSLISLFNELSVKTPMEVDWDFAYVLSAALDLAEVTQGAYDVTVNPLSDLWGFGPAGPTQFPSDDDIRLALASVGSEHLEWQSDIRRLSKLTPGVELDFSSVAKG